MNHKHLHYMEPSNRSIITTDPSELENSLTSVRLMDRTAYKLHLQTSQLEIMMILCFFSWCFCMCANALLIWKSAEIRKCFCCFWPSTADSAASAALPWPITQNHLYSPPLTFHPSFYHWAIPPNCTVQCNCIHAKKTTTHLRLKFIKQDTVELLCMTYKHSLLYNQSQNNILKRNYCFFKKENRQVSPLNPFDKLTTCGDLPEHVLLKYLFVIGRYYLELKCYIDWTRTVNKRDEENYYGVR